MKIPKLSLQADDEDMRAPACLGLPSDGFGQLVATGWTGCLQKKPAGCGLARCVPQSDHYTKSHTHRLIHKTSLEPPIVAKFMFTSGAGGGGRGGGVNQIIMVGGKRHEKDKGNKCNVSPWGKNLTRPHGPMPAKGLKVPPPANCSCLQKPLPLSAQFREREPVRICELGYSDFNKFEKARTLKVEKCKSKTISNRSSEQASAQSFFVYFLRGHSFVYFTHLWLNKPNERFI